MELMCILRTSIFYSLYFYFWAIYYYHISPCWVEKGNYILYEANMQICS